MNFAVFLALTSTTLQINISQNLKGVFDWLWDNVVKPIMDAVGYVFGGVINAIRAPFDALVQIWNNWWYSVLGFGWYSPIIGLLVVAACLIIVGLLWKFQSYIL